jgi:hypothetical protein
MLAVQSYRSASQRKLWPLATVVQRSLLYGLPPKYKKLTNSDGARNKPAVDYPASDVESIVFRADMESA